MLEKKNILNQLFSVRPNYNKIWLRKLNSQKYSKWMFLNLIYKKPNRLFNNLI